MADYTALLNPISGGGRAAASWAPVARRLREAGAAVRVERTRSREHAVELAAAAAADGSTVVAVGGDGLVRDAACGVVAAGGALAVVPAGRGNDLARTLGIPDDPGALAELLLTTPPRAIDVLEVNGVIVPGNVYAGIDAVATAMINSSRWIPGPLLYRLAPVRAVLSWRPVRYTLTVDGRTRTMRGQTVVVGNSGAYGHGLRIVPPARLDDGLLDVLVVGDGPLRKIVSFMREAKAGTHLRRPEVGHETGREITLSADRPVPLCADGDQIGTLPATVRLLPAALRVIAPEPPAQPST
ncbi:diacylglycerol kinase family protein [Saccharopolyspora taberi]|uniref:Diacylglycerol kinase family protein n=1 Tax=Saccharopolyspora taberi TaxID=60895 RepID=A0ABN3V2Y9_9PSEU